ncbi:MAG: TlpA family protein disulfide reductase [Actinobacteria bacterium]|nr:TlpA family protein disulfide reductase [Actinomycetota bacterium]MBI3685978.1 TlpA family protein disulfide reductase [Actinomycetota bacterium]
MAVPRTGSRFPRRLAAFLAAVAVAGLTAGCATGGDAVDPNAGGQFRFVAGDGTGRFIPAESRRQAPHFTGEYLGGGAFDSASLTGRIAVINFWGSWCGPCRVETPAFQKVYEGVKAKGVEFVGIDVKDSDQAALAFLQNKGITFRSVFDPDGRIALAFRGFPPNSIPSTIILDRSGKVAQVHLGAMLGGDLQPVLDRLLAER